MARRLASSTHDCGRYNNAPSNHARVPVQSAAVTATWQLAILPRAPQYWRATPTRVGPLFRKTGAIEDQHPATLGQHVQQATPDPVGIPRCMRDEVLKRLIRHRLRDTRQHRLHRFALAVAEHTLHVRAQGEPLRPMTEAALERLEPAHQSLNPRGGGAIEHRDAA